jgi:pimeloyl-ACP methyl ester carboxylesterase
MRSLILTTLTLALALTGCVKRYAAEPALEFADVPYAGPDGQEWPLKSVTLPGAKERYKLAHDPTLRYVELNPDGARTIVFLHGLGSYLKFWRSQLDLAAQKGFRVIAIDQLGFGKSDKPATFPYTTEAFAENVVELLDLLHVDRAILVGHSMGGQTALSTAIRFPDRVAALVLASPAGFEFFSSREQKWFKLVYFRGLVKDADEEMIWGNVRDANFMHWSSDHEWLIEERVRLAKNADFDAYAYAQVRTVEGLAQNGFVRDSLGKVQAPTLIIYGSADRLIPNAFLHGGFTKDIMQAGHAAIPGSELTELPWCGHTVQLDCAAGFNAAMFGFLEKLAATPAPATPGAN